jgi:hypothetical protein
MNYRLQVSYSSCSAAEPVMQIREASVNRETAVFKANRPRSDAGPDCQNSEDDAPP